MNTADEYVTINLNSQERKQIIKEYDSWCKNGYIDEGVLWEHARLVNVYIYGDSAPYCPPIGTTMKDLYNSVCRFYTNLYLSKSE